MDIADSDTVWHFIRVGSDFCVSFSRKEKNTKNRIHGQTTVKCRLNRFGKVRKRLQI